MEPAYRRHDLVWLDRSGALETYAENPAQAGQVREWISAGNPLVVARQPPAASVASAVSLGFTLAPPLTRQRVSVLVPSDVIIRHSAPLGLFEALPYAPECHGLLMQLIKICDEIQIRVCVYGALSWQALTGRSYLTGASDIDLLFYCGDIAAARRLCRALAPFRDSLPRLDGEIVSDSGMGVAWHELDAVLNRDGGSLLAKSLHEARLVSIADFFDARCS